MNELFDEFFIPRNLRLYPHSKNVALGDCTGDLRLLGNASPCNARSNKLVFQININADGLYLIKAKYASAQERPVEVSVDGNVIRSDALKEASGGWSMDSLIERHIAKVRLKKGWVLIQISSPSVFPHISEISFEETD